MFKLVKDENGDFVIKYRENGKVIYIKAESREYFKELIQPYMCESMNYKIIGHIKHSELLEN